jgi:hypothetical protein
MTHTRASLLGRICTVVARARGGTTTPDKAGEASRYLAPVRLKCDARAGLAPGNAVFAGRWFDGSYLVHGWRLGERLRMLLARTLKANKGI